ncbi:hypothetical protein VUR80DRAFT_310 [Thermomyces stellatus]
MCSSLTKDPPVLLSQGNPTESLARLWISVSYRAYTKRPPCPWPVPSRFTKSVSPRSRHWLGRGPRWNLSLRARIIRAVVYGTLALIEGAGPWGEAYRRSSPQDRSSLPVPALPRCDGLAREGQRCIGRGSCTSGVSAMKEIEKCIEKIADRHARCVT